jgi:hypothetical protein
MTISKNSDLKIYKWLNTGKISSIINYFHYPKIWILPLQYPPLNYLFRIAKQYIF